jgi:GTP-binding protein
MSAKIIAIIGRPNVGKSTLFNRIIGERNAIVDDMPGVTRDRKYAESEWAGKKFTIIDTGGYVPTSEDVFEKAIREQAQIAIEEADGVVFVVDAVDGILPLDKEIANILRKSEKQVFLVVNKIDSEKRIINLNEFYELGLGEPIPISALSGRQTGDFLDVITADISPSEEESSSEARLRIAIVGKPNVGKSSLANALLGEQRHVVTEIPGTTRDPIDSVVKYYGEEFLLVDTAGLRKKSKIYESLEFYSVLRTMRSIDRSDVAVILLDAQQGIDKQDQHIVELVMERKRSALIAVNKWDLIEKDTNTARDIEALIHSKLGLYDFLPVVFISALTKQRIGKVLERAKEIHTEQCRRIETSTLNGVLLPVIKSYPPSTPSPKEIKIKYITQIKSKPPMFAFFCNEPKLIQESYKRFLENRMREHFGFRGVPLSLIFKVK